MRVICVSSLLTYVLCYKGSFELSRAIFDVLATFQLKTAFGQYPGLIGPLKRDQQRILRIVKGEASVGKEAETAAATAEAGCSCCGTPTWATGSTSLLVSRSVSS